MQLIDRVMLTWATNIPEEWKYRPLSFGIPNVAPNDTSFSLRKVYLFRICSVQDAGPATGVPV